jgi:hypothetical protein
MAFDIPAGTTVKSRVEWVAGAIAALALLGVGCRRHASPDDCRAMADHYVELAAEETPRAAGLSPAQLAAVREVERGLKRAEPSYRRVEDHCAEVTRAEVSCATDSTSTEAWEGCLGNGGQ